MENLKLDRYNDSKLDHYISFDDPDYFFELRHDGCRCVAYIERGRCRLVSIETSKW